MRSYVARTAAFLLLAALACGTVPELAEGPERAALLEAVRQTAHPLTGAPEELDPLLTLIGDAQFVLIGEASHGTHEFYRARAELTQRLIEEKGFTAVAIEGDWPAAYRVNAAVRGWTQEPDPLADFDTFPHWMWRNTDVRDFVQWLGRHNAEASAAGQPMAGFYGLDLYSPAPSAQAVVAYLETVDPPAARRARDSYACVGGIGRESQSVGFFSGASSEACVQGLRGELLALQQQSAQYIGQGGEAAREAWFNAVQNAQVVVEGARYFMEALSGTSSWNLRDQHMARTLEQLAEHLGRQGTPAKVVVWAHNSHVGDARATEPGDEGQLTLGQLVRTAHGARTFLLGFTTYEGSVAAATQWEGPPRHRQVRPALPQSQEAVFHDTGLQRFLLPLRTLGEAHPALNAPWLQRAIGVLYLPETERQSHYFFTRLTGQFDAIIHLDTSRAVEPLEKPTGWDRPPER
jgi:erythromycin esterase-like protein